MNEDIKMILLMPILIPMALFGLWKEGRKKSSSNIYFDSREMFWWMIESLIVGAFFAYLAVKY